VVESAHDEPEAARPTVDAGQPEASIARPDEYLMASSVKAAVVAPGVGASSVDPLPYILGDDSFESEGDAAGAGSAFASASEETTFVKASRSTKAQHLEESKTEFDEWPSSVLPQGSKAVPTSPHAMGIGASGFIVEPLHLGKFNL